MGAQKSLRMPCFELPPQTPYHPSPPSSTSDPPGVTGVSTPGYSPYLYPHLAIYLPINSEGPYKGHNCGTKRATAKSIATIPAESIPFIEVAVLVADIGYELYPACETVRDLDQLYSDLGMADEAPEDAMHSVATQSCQMRGKSRCD
jgi:hypothetical protein